MVGAHVTRHARSASDARRVQERLAAANTRWDNACARAAAWQGRLQTALVNNREFHDIGKFILSFILYCSFIQVFKIVSHKYETPSNCMCDFIFLFSFSRYNKFDIA